MAIKVKPNILKVWKNYIRLINSILHIVLLYKKTIALTIKSMNAF